MLDVKFLRDDLTRVKERLATRGTEIDWDEFVYLDQQRRDTLARIEKLKERKNRLSGEIGKVKKSGGQCGAPLRSGAYSHLPDARPQPPQCHRLHRMRRPRPEPKHLTASQPPRLSRPRPQ